MKQIYQIAFFLLLCCGMSSCFFVFQPEKREVSRYTPITMTRAQLNESVKMQTPRALKTTGKIYTYGSYLFINERYEGVHIINNANPSNPQKIGFVAVPGCLDMAVKSNVLYVDNAIDLVAINITNPDSPTITKRITDAFPMNALSPDGYLYAMSSDKIIVGWTLN